MADRAITTKDAVLNNWRTIGRCELILSLTVVMGGVNKHSIQTKRISTVYSFNIWTKYQKKNSTNKFSPIVTSDEHDLNLFTETGGLTHLLASCYDPNI